MAHNVPSVCEEAQQKRNFYQQENNMKKFIQNIKGFFAKRYVSGNEVLRVALPFFKEVFERGWKEGKYFQKNYNSLEDDAKAIREQIEEDWKSCEEEIKKRQ